MPLAIALGLTAGGSAMQIVGNQQEKNAINKVRADYVAKQQALQRENSALFDKSMAASTPDVAAKEMQAGESARNNIWNQLQQASVPVASALPANRGSAATKASGQSGAAGSVWNKLLANAAAREGSYGDWETQQAIKNADTAQKESMVNNFAGGNERLLPTELAVAQQAGGRMQGWGGILSSLGQLAGLASASGAFSASPKAATATPTAAQMGALNAGFGPVNAGYAATLQQPSIWGTLYGG